VAVVVVVVAHRSWRSLKHLGSAEQLNGGKARNVGAARANQSLAEGVIDARRKEVTVAEQRAAEDRNSLLQGNLDVAYIGLGDALLSAGKRQEALDIYLKGLAIREKLVISDPGNRDWQRQLIVNYLTIGDLHFNTGNRQEALATYRKCLAVAEKVAASDPSNLSWSRDLGLAYERIGMVLAAAGDRLGALNAYRASLDISEKLVALDPVNITWRRDLPAISPKVRLGPGHESVERLDP
jgi:tetratricopeptide (TPR) repeat protein